MIRLENSIKTNYFIPEAIKAIRRPEIYKQCARLVHGIVTCYHTSGDTGGVFITGRPGSGKGVCSPNLISWNSAY